MSSIGTMRETTPLLPWRPAILSPGWILRFTATKTLTIFITPGGSSSPRCSFSTLSRKRCSRPLLRLVVLLAHRLDLAHQLVVGDGERSTTANADIPRITSLVSLVSFLKPFGPAIAVLPSRSSARRA